MQSAGRGGPIAPQGRRSLFWPTLVILLVIIVAGPLAIQRVQAEAQPVGTASPRDAGVPAQALTVGEPLRFGRADAPHVVQLYEDAHCPHCVDFERSHGPELYAALTDGRARLELWPMALIDEGSMRAATGIACAAQAGYGLSYHELVFANPKLTWNDAQLSAVAEKAAGRVDPGFGQCVGSHAFAEVAPAATTRAKAAGIKTTPTLIVDGAAVTLDDKLTPAALKAKLS